MKKKSELEKENVHEECCCGGNCNCKKMKKSTWIIIILLIIVLVFCLGLGVGTFVLESDSSDKCVLRDSNDGINSEDYAYKIIMDRIDKLGIMKNLNRDINNVSELTNQELLLFASNYVERNKEDYSFTLEDVNKITKEYFGRTVKGEDINCAVTEEKEVSYFFDKENGVFKINDNHSGHGGRCIDEIYVLNRIEDFAFDGSKYIVKVKKAFSYVPDTGFSTEFYRTYDDFSESNLLFDVEVLESIDGNPFVYPEPEVEFKYVQDEEMYTFEYVFEKNDTNYVLVSYKINK